MEQFKGTVLITGGTSGIGFEAASLIAKKRPDLLIVIASRSNNGSAEKINQKLRQNNVLFAALDLSSTKKVRAFARSWSDGQYPPIKALLLNAILQSMSKLEYSDDGFERTFAISHVGHALLLALLASHMDNTARIVITGSGVHDPLQGWKMPQARYETAELLAHPPTATQSSSGFAQYTSTKLANVLWMYALDRRLRAANERYGRHWTVTQIDPGMMPGTSLSRTAGPIAQWIFNHILGNMLPLLRLLIHPRIFTPEKCGRVLADLAVDDKYREHSGAYFEDWDEVKTSVDSYDEVKQEDLWKWTVETLARDDKERKLFECDFR